MAVQINLGHGYHNALEPHLRKTLDATIGRVVTFVGRNPFELSMGTVQVATATATGAFLGSVAGGGAGLTLGGIATNNLQNAIACAVTGAKFGAVIGAGLFGSIATYIMSNAVRSLYEEQRTIEMHQAVLELHADRQELSEFLCPITHEIFINPYKTPAGHAYELEALTTWILENGTDPLTRASLRLEDLTPDFFTRKEMYVAYKEILENDIPHIDSPHLRDGLNLLVNDLNQQLQEVYRRAVNWGNESLRNGRMNLREHAQYMAEIAPLIPE